MNNYISFDIGGSAVKWSIINLNGEFLDIYTKVLIKVVF